MAMKRTNGFHASPPVDAEGVVLVDLSLNPIALDPGAAAIFRTNGQRRGKADGAIRLPDEMLETFRGHNPEDLPFRRAHIRVGQEQYVCRGYLLQPSNGVLSRPILALYIHKDSSTLDAVEELAAEYDLTEREREALIGLCMGLTCKELAQRMNISPNTVKAFLRLVMIKLGVGRRSAIITKLLEFRGDKKHTAI